MIFKRFVGIVAVLFVGLGPAVFVFRHYQIQNNRPVVQVRSIATSTPKNVKASSHKVKQGDPTACASTKGADEVDKSTKGKDSSECVTSKKLHKSIKKPTSVQTPQPSVLPTKTNGP